jgi:signal transduction histidine kinase
MKISWTFLLLLSMPACAYTQQRIPDSIRKILQRATNDSLKYEASRALYGYYEEVNRDSALHYAEQNLLLARKNNKKLVEVMALDTKAYQVLHKGQYSQALQCLLLAFTIIEDPKTGTDDGWTLSTYPSPGKSKLLMLTITHHMMGILMLQTGNHEQEILHFKEAGRIAGQIGNPFRLLLANMNLGNSYLLVNQPDSAFVFAKNAEHIALQAGIKKYLGHIYSILGEVYLDKADKAMAKQFFYRGLQLSEEQNNLSSLSRNYLRLTRYYLGEQQKDSALYYALKHFQIVQSMGAILGLESNIGIAYENIYLGYKLRGQFDSAFKYQGLALIAKDSISKVRIKNLGEFQNLNFGEQLRLQNLEKEKVVYQDKVRTYAFLGGAAGFLLILFILYRNNRQKHQANKVLEKTLTDLKATQSQLVQSEKMASLGELTAGIAHEIQNPLNFVNNFSEINKEMIAEMKAEIAKGNYEEVKNIADDIAGNEEKINHHGRRADAIVKGMLQHSRGGSGSKEQTSINKLADEYLRLAYHGLRAKDKLFNAALHTDFDDSIGSVPVIPQDMGRVLLNLYTNAFYAVAEKKKQRPLNYEPAVSVSTRKNNGSIEITVTDNGNGIPQKIIDKIFQPFFTTKPTGQGTGLGLSLAYDIVKAHGGTLAVQTKENEDTSFFIRLPAG